jgi:hypothetical protein
VADIDVLDALGRHLIYVLLYFCRICGVLPVVLRPILGPCHKGGFVIRRPTARVDKVVKIPVHLRQMNGCLIVHMLKDLQLKLGWKCQRP